MILKFGKYKGKDLREVPTDYLDWLIKNTDPNDPKYGAKNQEMLDALYDEMNSREDGLPKEQGSEPRPANSWTPPSQAPLVDTGDLISQIRGHVEAIYKETNQMRLLIDVYKNAGINRNAQNTPY